MESNREAIKLSVIIPVYNEAGSVKSVIEGLKNELNRLAGQLAIEYEIIAVNDGSTDKSGETLKSISGIKVIEHPYNKGYGASLKTGAKKAVFEWLLFFDSDGQHKPEYIKELLKFTDNYDMIIGERRGYKGPFWRQPGKRILHLIAEYLAERKIPDLNCGFRLLKKNYFSQYEHIFPDGFSLSATSTLAFLKEGHNVKYAPIAINRRQGKSSVKIFDGFRTIMLIVRLIMLFSPLKIFLPVSAAGFIISFGLIGYDLIDTRFQSISKTGGFIFIASLLTLLFGLLADQVAAIRRELKR